MTRIGLLSDTHGFLDDRIQEYFNLCDEIWHAGDIGNIEILDTLESWKTVRAVSGNIDGHKLKTVVPEIQRFKCEKVDVLMKHIGGYPGKYDPSIYSTIVENPPDLFISGHSHILKVVNDPKNKLLHINPGAAGKNGLHKVRTVVRFAIDSAKILDLEVIEMEQRF